jgi:hypothetical protein
MSQADTPDYQRGVVAAQKLLATVPDTETSVTVGVPANAETIVVLAPGSLNPEDFTCTGATSGLNYPPTPYGPSVTGADTTSIVFDVSAAVDDQVTITYGFAPAFVWYVYSDSGVHVTTSPYLARVQNQIGGTAPVDGLQIAGTDGTDLQALRTDTRGAQFTVGSVPGTGSGDHPPTELSVAAAIPSGQAVVVPAPGAGKRIRVFTMCMTSDSGALIGYLYDSVTGVALAVASQVSNMTVTLPPQGHPLTENASLNYLLYGGSGLMIVIAYYTIETV